jgi:4-nitrophenyl phosphatase
MENLLSKKAFILDLDGCVYRGSTPIDGASAAIQMLRTQGKKILFLTNNSTKTAEEYVNKLNAMGVQVALKEILTSSLAIAQYLKKVKIGRCYIIGEIGLYSALQNEGFTILDEEHSRLADYMVCGLDTRVNYEKLAAACYAIQNGAKFFATNTDPSLPVEGGYLPGAGAIVSAISIATNIKPTIVGKPSKKIMEIALSRLGAKKEEAAIMGDTLKFDIKAGINSGIFSVLVLTGSTSKEDLRKSRIKPDMIFSSISDLLRL